jgi:NDP-sugar pyrophosphorylase family protein
MDAGHTVHTLQYEGYWRDIGNPADYEAAISDFDADPDEFLGPREDPPDAGGPPHAIHPSTAVTPKG